MAEPSAAQASARAASRPASLPVNGRPPACGPLVWGSLLPLVDPPGCLPRGAEGPRAGGPLGGGSLLRWAAPPVCLPRWCTTGVFAGVPATPPLVDDELIVPVSWPPPMSTETTVPSDVVTPVAPVPPSAV